jgi:ribosomal protein L23
MFDVDVKDVRTVRTKGKLKQRHTRRGTMTGRTNLRKKAYVTLMPGQTIDIVSGEGGTEE